MSWFAASLLVVVLWGVVGLLQKLGANRCSAESLFVWTTAGYLLLVPLLALESRLPTLSARALALGLLGGLTNALGAWYLYRSMERGARASVAVPLTALNPLLTVALAVPFLGERLTLTQAAGVVLALLAGVLLSYETEPAVSAKRHGAPQRP